MTPAPLSRRCVLEGVEGQCGPGGRGREFSGRCHIVPHHAPALRSLSFWLMTWLFDLWGSTSASFPTPTPWPFRSTGLSQREAERKIHVVLHGEELG